jgi:hypothetical protein
MGPVRARVVAVVAQALQFVYDGHVQSQAAWSRADGRRAVSRLAPVPTTTVSLALFLVGAAFSFAATLAQLNAGTDVRKSHVLLAMAVRSCGIRC